MSVWLKKNICRQLQLFILLWLPHPHCHHPRQTKAGINHRYSQSSTGPAGVIRRRSFLWEEVGSVRGVAFGTMETGGHWRQRKETVAGKWRDGSVLWLTRSPPQPAVGLVCLSYLQDCKSLQQSQTLGNSRLP